MKLKQAMRATPGIQIAFTGAGGKTTAVFLLARELQAEGTPVIVTTSTHLSVAEVRMGDEHLQIDSIKNIDQLLSKISGVTVITSSAVLADRFAGPRDDVASQVSGYARRHGIPLIIEADGSRRRSLKAPADHEPVVPGDVDVVVVTAGLSGVGLRLQETNVHRPEIFAEIAGIEVGDTITAEAAARVLMDPAGGLKGLPSAARKIALLNQADTPATQALAGRIAEVILPVFDSVLLASLGRPDRVLAVQERAAAIILAGGGSSRMGSPKQLLAWHGQTLAAHTVGIATAAGCDPVIVVTGSARDQVRAALAHLPIKEIYNPDWEAGQSTSVRAGLKAVPSGAGSAVFFLVDQPFVEPSMVRSIVDMHARTLSPIVAPLIDEQRGNPVLFDRLTFDDFDDLRGDAGGRMLFSRYPVEWVPWHNPKALMDMDTIADYEKLLADSDH